MTDHRLISTFAGGTAQPYWPAGAMTLLLPVSIALVLVGCNVDEHLNSSSQSVVTHNRLSSNRLAANRLSSNRLSSNQLSSSRLSSNRFSLIATDLIETDGGREVLTYLVGCALPESITLVGADSHGNPFEFFGEIGLAPRWLDHPLNHTGKGWVSACLFARVNMHGLAVPVSVRGPSSALTSTPDERANWTLQEGAFYGMFFTPPGQPINWIACRGRDSAQAQLRLRECAQPDPLNPGKTLCGFNFAGDCGRYVVPPTPTACRAFSPNGFYLDCADHAIFAPGHNEDDHDDGDDDGHGHVFRQVITAFVHP